MRIDCFLDTNVLIYAALGAKNEPRKHSIAMDLVRRKDFGLSGQILAEFAYQTSLKAKGRTPLPPHVVDQWFEVFGEATIAPVDVPIVQGGLALARRFQISYWDGAIIAAAERLGAPILYTEDLRHEQHYGAVQVINPLL